MTETLGLNAADVALIVGMVQCGLIAWGIRAMREGNKGRDAVLSTLSQQSETLTLHTRALERLLERMA